MRAVVVFWYLSGCPKLDGRCIGKSTWLNYALAMTVLVPQCYRWVYRFCWPNELKTKRNVTTIAWLLNRFVSTRKTQPIYTHYYPLPTPPPPPPTPHPPTVIQINDTTRWQHHGKYAAPPKTNSHALHHIIHTPLPLQFPKLFENPRVVCVSLASRPLHHSFHSSVQISLRQLFFCMLQHQ